MKHSHDHPGSHSISQPPRIMTDKVFKIGISLNLLFVCIEIYFGITHNSLALVSDGVHNFTDVFGLVIAWLGYLLSKNLATKKFSIYAAFINTSLLLITSIWIISEAYERYLLGHMPIATTIIVVASIGFMVNFFTAKLFHKDHHHDLNIKSAYLHLMADAAISLGVVVAGFIIYYKSILWIDPVISAVIAVIIIFGTWSFFKESLIMLMGKTPLSVHLTKVKSSILLQSEIKDVIAIKVWALSTSENALTAKIKVSSILNEEQIEDIKHRLLHEFKITSAVFEQVGKGDAASNTSSLIPS